MILQYCDPYLINYILQYLDFAQRFLLIYVSTDFYQYCYYPYRQYELLYQHAKNHEKNIIKYYFKMGFKPNPSTCLGATITGDLKFLKWCHKKYKCPYTSDILYNAAFYGHHNIIKFLRPRFMPNKCSIKYDSLIPPISQGRLSTVKLLIKRGAPFDKYICHVAAFYKQIEILQYLRKIQYPWCFKCYQYAIINDKDGDSLPIIQWMNNNGLHIYWNANLIKYYAQRHKKDKVLNWLNLHF